MSGRSPAGFVVGALLPVLAAGVCAMPLHAASPPPTAAHWKPIRLLDHFAVRGVFDAARHRFLVIPDDGGPEGGTDLWALDTRDPAGWFLVPTLGPAPPAHSGGVVVLDAVHQRVLVWGGYRFVPGTDPEFWLLDLAATTPTWSHHVGAGTPPQRMRQSAAAYDAARNRFLLFGGAYDSLGTRIRGDVWALDLAGTPTWSPLAIAGPAPTPRYDGAAIYDPVRDRLVIHGGMDQLFGGPRSDAWALDLAGTPAWTRLWQGNGSTDGQRSHVGLYDPAGDRMLLYGGTDSASGYNGSYHDDVRALPLAAPAPPVVIADTTGAPHNVGACAAILDPVPNALFVHGDGHNPGAPAVTWRFDLAATPHWTHLLGPDVQAPQRFGQAQAWDARRQRMVFFGGRITNYAQYGYSSFYYDDTWSLELGGRPVWTPLVAQGAGPPSRQFATLVADPDADRMWLYGGNHTTVTWPSSVLIEVFTNVWRLDLGGPTPVWTQPAIGGAWPGSRDGHSAVLDSRRHRMLLFGGRGAGPLKNDLWALSLDDPPQWTLVTPAGTPPPGRMFHVAGYDWGKDRMYVYGGIDTDGAMRTDLWVLSLSGEPVWIQVPTAGVAPPTLNDRPGFFDATHRRLVVIGEGTEGTPTSVFVLSLDQATPTWTEVPAAGVVPSDMTGRSAAIDERTGEIVALWGAEGAEPTWPVETLAHRIALDEVPQGAVDVPAVASPAMLSLGAPSPHPAHLEFRITGALAARMPATLELIDAAGRRRNARSLPAVAGPFEARFSTARLSAGLYFVRLVQAGRSSVTKLVVVH